MDFGLDEIVKAFIVSLGSILLGITGILKLKQDKRFKLLIHARSPWTSYVKSQDDVQVDILRVLNNTRLDRFLALELIQYKDPKKQNTVSAFILLRTAEQEERDYRDHPVDLDYESRVAETERGIVVYQTAPMPSCVISDIYLDEKVKVSAWGYLDKVEDKENGITRTTFFSASSHTTDDISKGEIAQIRAIQGELITLKQIYENKYIH